MNKLAENTWRYFQEKSYVTMKYDSEVGGTSISTTSDSNRIYPAYYHKGMFKSYLPGPVKIYTEEEIRQYERDRDD